MKNNFLEFINKDIESKKNLISNLPTKTKTNKKHYNEALLEMKNKYKDYEETLKNYLLAKSRSFNIKEEKNNIDELNNKLLNLEHVRFIINPYNTYFEKMGFDELIYKLSNFYVFNFTSLEDIIVEFLDKFKLANIILSSRDFDYTCFVNEYMTVFLECYNSNNSFDKAKDVFEKIYWVNPEIVEHIELNLRLIINKYSKKFISYINNLQNKLKESYQIKSYDDCLNKIQDIYIELSNKNKDNIYDIINYAKTSEINMEDYLDDSKVKKEIYLSLLNIENQSTKIEKKKIYELEKLKGSILEYEKYLEFLPIINFFTDKYRKFIIEEEQNDNKKDKKEESSLKQIEDKILGLRKELDKLNKKIFKKSIFNLSGNKINNKELKLQSMVIAKNIYEAYKTYDEEYFNLKVKSVLNRSFTVTDILNIYYSYGYFKKRDLKTVYEITDYDELVRLSDNFDLFAISPTNIISDGIQVFSDNDVSKIISNKYIKNGINIVADELTEDNLNNILSRINLIIRDNIIKSSNLDVDKLWFIQKVEKIIEKSEEKS